MIRSGEIRWFRFPEPDKRRPVLVLGNEAALSAWSRIPVVPLSTQIRSLPWEVRLGPLDGLPEESVLKVDWINSVDRAKLGPLLATFPNNRWPELRAAIILGLGL